jgi:hypothetical protein
MTTKVCTYCKIEKDLTLFGNCTVVRKSQKILSKRCRCKQCETEIQRNRRNKEKEADPEKYHKRWADYYAETKEQNKLSKKNWMSNPENRKARNEYIRKYKAQKRLTDPNFKIYENLRKRIWKCLKNKSNSSKELLGCDIENYKKWIEYTMSKEMTWQNYGTYWNIDHVTPIDSFDLSNKDDVLKAFNWKNTWAMISVDNFSKNSHIVIKDIIKQQKLLKRYCSKNNIVIVDSEICSQASIKVDEGSTTR